MIHLTPRYKPVLKLSKPEIKSIHIWSDEAVESLQSCLEQTDWNVFINNCPDIEQLTDTVNSYIMFREDLIIPRRTIKVFKNNKPWMTKEIKESMLNKKIAFKHGTSTSEFISAKIYFKRKYLKAKNYKNKKLKVSFI